MYLTTLDEFKDLTTLPGDYVDALERSREGWVMSRVAYWSAWVNARLSKRYAVPFVAPFPAIVCGWVSDLVTMDCWTRRGFDPTTADMQTTIEAAQRARDEVKEAADGDKGLFELPERADLNKVATSRGGPRSYTEASPYVWTSRQAEVGRDEDHNGGGTFRG